MKDIDDLAAERFGDEPRALFASVSIALCAPSMGAL
jgi:hypothetical protein